MLKAILAFFAELFGSEPAHQGPRADDYVRSSFGRGDSDLDPDGDIEIEADPDDEAASTPQMTFESSGERRFDVLCTRLAGDRLGDSMVQITQALRGRSGIIPDQVDMMLHSLPMEYGAEGLAQAVRSGWGLLEERKADAVIWGEVSDEGLYRLRLIFQDKDGDPMRGAVSLADHISLPTANLLDGIAMLETALVSSIRPRNKAQRGLRETALPAALERLDTLMHSEAEEAPYIRSASAQILHAEMVAVEARRKSDPMGLRKAAAHLKALAGVIDKDELPLLWALAQLHRGQALYSLIEFSHDPTFLEDAAEAYRMATKEALLKETTVEWANAKSRLGHVLHWAAVHHHDAKPLEESLASFREALLVFSKATYPKRWAETQGRLGMAMGTYGELADDMDALGMAAKAVEAAALSIDKEQDPSDWAAARTNLGGVLMALGKRTENASALRGAQEAFQMASETHRGIDQLSLADQTQTNADRAARLLAAVETREAGKAQQAIEDAKAAAGLIQPSSRGGLRVDAGRIAEQATENRADQGEPSPRP